MSVKFAAGNVGKSDRSVFVGCGHYLVCHHGELSNLVYNEVDLIKYYEKGKYDMPFGGF